MSENLPNTIPGLFLKTLFSQIKKEFGKEKLEKIISQVPELRSIHMTGSYPVELELQLRKQMLSSLFGKDNRENRLKLGRFHCRAVAGTSFGAAFLNLGMLKDPKRLVRGVVTLNNTFTGGMKTIGKITGENTAITRFENYPYHPDHYEGVIQQGIDIVGGKMKVETKVIDPRVVEYHLSWKREMKKS